MNQTNNLAKEEKQIRKDPFHFRNKSLLKVAVLYVNFFYNPEAESAKPIIKRLNEEHLAFRKANIAFLLKPSDVTPILKCSRRTAKEYIDLLRLVI